MVKAGFQIKTNIRKNGKRLVRREVCCEKDNVGSGACNKVIQTTNREVEKSKDKAVVLSERAQLKSLLALGAQSALTP